MRKSILYFIANLSPFAKFTARFSSLCKSDSNDTKRTFQWNLGHQPGHYTSTSISSNHQTAHVHFPFDLLLIGKTLASTRLRLTWTRYAHKNPPCFLSFFRGGEEGGDSRSTRVFTMTQCNERHVDARVCCFLRGVCSVERDIFERHWFGEQNRRKSGRLDRGGDLGAASGRMGSRKPQVIAKMFCS